MTRPTVQFLFSHPTHFLALGMGSGLSPKAPGTVGTMAAVPLYLLLAWALPPQLIVLSVPLWFLLGIWLCDRTGRDLGVSDHGAIVWDEIVAYLLVMAALPQTLLWFVIGFGFFRLFDIWKPFPINYFDEKVRGGLGVMLDDLVAAFYTLGVCLVLQYITPR